MAVKAPALGCPHVYVYMLKKMLCSKPAESVFVKDAFCTAIRKFIFTTALCT